MFHVNFNKNKWEKQGLPNILDRVEFRANKISTNRTLSNEINSLGEHNNPTSLHSKQM